MKIDNAWCYLCTVIDLATREVVGWSLADHMRASMVIQAVKSAVKRRGLEVISGLILSL